MVPHCSDADRACGSLAAAAASAAVSRYGHRTAAKRHRRCDTDDCRKSVGGEGDGLRGGDGLADRAAWSHRTDGVWRQSDGPWSVSGRGDGISACPVHFAGRTEHFCR